MPEAEVAKYKVDTAAHGTPTSPMAQTLNVMPLTPNGTNFKGDG